jgi:hypothetical protein
VEGEVFDAIWSSGEDLWVVGHQTNVANNQGQPDAPVPGGLTCPRDFSASVVVKRRMGDTWEAIDQPATTAITDIHGTGSEDVWMVGLAGSVLRFDGTGWEVHDVRTAEGLEFDEPANPCAELSLNAVFAIAPNDVWVVGYVFPSTLGPGLVLHFDGKQWARHALDAPDGLLDVWAASESDVWVVGSSGTIEHFDGARWSPIDGNTNQSLSSVFGTGVNDVWIAGDGGTLRHFDGKTLSASPAVDKASAAANFSGNATETSLLTTTWASGAFRQDVWGLADGDWTSMYQNFDEGAGLARIVATSQGQLWGAGNVIVRLR